MTDPRQRVAFVWSRNCLLLWNRKIHNCVKKYLSYCILSHFEIDYVPIPFFNTLGTGDADLRF